MLLKMNQEVVAVSFPSSLRDTGVRSPLQRLLWALTPVTPQSSVGSTTETRVCVCLQVFTVLIQAKSLFCNSVHS